MLGKFSLPWLNLNTKLSKIKSERVVPHNFPVWILHTNMEQDN